MKKGKIMSKNYLFVYNNEEKDTDFIKQAK